MRKLVSIAGGTGQSHIAPALAAQTGLDLSCICPTSDSGGFTRALLDDRGAGPVGDIVDVLCALAPNPVLSRGLLHRFTPATRLLSRPLDGGRFEGHGAGHFLLAALQEQAYGSLELMCRLAHQALGLPKKVRVLPATDSATTLVFTRRGKRRIEIGEHLLDRIPRRPLPPIETIRLQPFIGSGAPVIARLAFEALDDAEIVLLGPGDFVGSVLASVMVPRFTEALYRAQARQAKVVLAINLVNKATDSYGFTAGQFVAEFERFTGIRIDIVVCNTTPLPRDVAARYRKEHAGVVKVDIEDGWNRKTVITDDFLEIDEAGRARHKLRTFVPALVRILG